MHYVSHLVLFVLGLAIISCKNTPAPVVVDRPAELENSLIGLDSQMTAKNGLVADTAKAAAFIKTAEEYAALVETSQPDKYADLILKAAGVAKSVGNSAKALALYTAIAEKLPQHPKAPMALFMEGFIYENDLGDTATARVKYQDFLKKYPNDPDFADDAHNALINLGKTPEEMIKEFEKLNKNRPQ